jgi:Fic family protein
MAYPDLASAVLAFLGSRPADPLGGATAAEITTRTSASRSTVNRVLLRLLQGGALRRTGVGPATRYVLAVDPEFAARLPSSHGAPAGSTRLASSRALRAALERPLTSRTPVAYERGFVDDYVPNVTALLPPLLAADLHRDGRAQGQQPAGTLARKVLEQLLIDLSWHSSRLEGNRKSLLATRELFARGRGDAHDPDATMLLNHKDAIEFLVEAAPEQGISAPVIRNLHGVLMQGLLDDPAAPGAIRRRLVKIADSVYQPPQVPSFLAEMLDAVIAKARAIHNPLEGAFFLWIHVAYLQPFEDGNKRTSRLAANLPLLLHNCAPLSFLDVDASDYAFAMLGVYEHGNVSLAIDLFEATYRRSIEQYRAALTAYGLPDPLRARYRDVLGDVVRRVVGGARLEALLPVIGVPHLDLDAFARLAREELNHLEVYNCARYRLTYAAVERWLLAGRPGCAGEPD